MLCALILVLGLVGLRPEPARAAEEGDPAPLFTLTDILSERVFGLAEFSGQVVVLNFWAYW